MTRWDAADRGSSGGGWDADRHRVWIASARRQLAAARDQPGSPLIRHWAATELPPADVLPGYELIREVHRGGQGVVYQAVQRSTGRSVAIKILKEGAFAGAADRARFEREVRILGVLQHPGIVTIHDFGSAGGNFYFTMDYIAGRSLDVFVSDLGRPVRGVFELFAGICDAVHAAHLLGIVHRDIKPRNILINAAGNPTVVDFGLAKLVPSEAAADEGSSEMTLTGQFVGSLPWASPEQIRGRHDAIDARSDVYSLGVVLYHALTGRFPYNLSVPPAEAMATIQRGEPISPRRVRSDLDSDIETILLKCLNKDPDRRYDTAGALAGDLRCFLNSEPIAARRDSLAYVMRKSLSRHRAAFGVAAGFALLITASLVASVVQWRRTVDQRDRAIRAERLANDQRGRAEVEAARAGAVSDFLQQTLASADPFVTDESDVKMSEVLQAAARELDAGAMRDHPEVEAISRITLGESYYSIGDSTESTRHAEAALALLHEERPEDRAEIARGLALLSNIRCREHEYAQAEELGARSVAMYRLAYGDNHADLAYALRVQANAVGNRSQAEGERLARDSLQMFERTLGDKHERTATAKLALADFLRHDANKRPEARRLLEEALTALRKPGGQHRPSEASALYDLGNLALFENDLAAAEKYLSEGLEVYRALLPADHPKVAGCMSNLAYVYDRLAKYDRSWALNTEALEMTRRAFGAESLAYYDQLRVVARVLSQMERLEEAEAAYREVLAGLVRIGHDQELSGANARIMLSRVVLKQGNAAEAEKLARDALAIDESQIAGSHQMRTHARCELGKALTAQGRFAEAETVLREAHERYKTHRLPVPSEKWTAAELLVDLYEKWDATEPGTGKTEQADEWRTMLADSKP